MSVDNRGKGSGNNEIAPKSQYVGVNSLGYCMWIPRYDDTVTQCLVDVRWFPFDEQKCDLIFESYTLRKWELQVVIRESASFLKHYVESNQYHVIGAYYITLHYKLFIVA